VYSNILTGLTSYDWNTRDFKGENKGTGFVNHQFELDSGMQNQQNHFVYLCVAHEAHIKGENKGTGSVNGGE